MTKFGYCVRRKEEFSLCSICSNAIPNKLLWERFKHHNIECPPKWSEKCSECV